MTTDATTEQVTTETEAIPPAGRWLTIQFFGHIEHTGYVTEIITHGGIPAYQVDLPEKVWGGNPMAEARYAASSWFGEQPVTEDSVRAAWEARLRAAEERARRQAEWERQQAAYALEAGSDDDDYENGPF